MAVRVRGDCPKCLKPVETNAPRNRVTWKGKCPATPGCDGIVLARRIKAGDPPATGTEQPPADPTTAPAAGRRSTIPKVTYGPRKPPAAGRQPADVPPAVPRPAGRVGGEPPKHEPRRDEPGPVTEEQPGRRPTRADRVETGATGRRPFAHLGY